MKSILSLIFIACTFNCLAQTGRVAVAFYNVENLFDTVDDPLTEDEEFTPTGPYRYTTKVYNQKLHNIATLISQLGGGSSLVGLAEIENNTVLKDLTSQPELKGYQYAWFNSPDPRGIDVALLYRGKDFKLLKARACPVKMKGMRTRDVLYVAGVLQGDTVHVLVNHWPSRREGKTESAPKRAAVAQINKTITDSLFKKNPNSKIIIMGDLNDNPADESITKTLQAVASKQTGKTAYLYNPWAAIHKTGKGTAVFQHKWDHFDQVIISGAWLNNKGLRYEKAEIFDKDFIRNNFTKGEAYPHRSFRGRNWDNGYSDHFPVIIYFSK